MRNIQTLSLLVVTAAALLAGCQSEQDIIDHVRTEIEDAHWAQRQVARYAAPQKKLTELLQQRPEVRHAIVSLQPDYTTTPIGPRPIVTFKIFVRLNESAEKDDETPAAETLSTKTPHRYIFANSKWVVCPDVEHKTPPTPQHAENQPNNAESNTQRKPQSETNNDNDKDSDNDGSDEFLDYLRQALADSGLTLERLYTHEQERLYTQAVNVIHFNDQIVITGRVRLRNSSAGKP